MPARRAVAPARASRPPPGAPAARAPARARSEEFARLSATIRRCQLCPLGRTRTHAVVYRGSLRPAVVFVGEAPGAEEDRTGRPFVGRSGRILDRAVRHLGRDLGEFGVLNVLKCRPPANRFDPGAARTCRPYLDRQLELLRPRLLVSLGARALTVLDPQAPPILRCAGAPRRSAWGPLFPLVHPAATLRSRRLAQRWTDDVERLRGVLATGRRETA